MLIRTSKIKVVGWIAAIALIGAFLPLYIPILCLIGIIAYFWLRDHKEAKEKIFGKVEWDDNEKPDKST